MKKITLLFVAILSGLLSLNAQMLERQIEATGQDTIVDDGDTIVLTVSYNDVEWENGEIDTFIDDDIDAGWEGDPEDFNILTAGFRFTNINVAQGSTIDSAFIEVTSHEAKSADDVALITIKGEAADNSSVFDYAIDTTPDVRPKTSAEILWTVDEPWGLWSTERTTDIKTVIQEIIDRDGWVSGNALTLFLIGSDEQGASAFDNAREMESFENIADPEDGGDGLNHPERRPKLIIYSDGVGISAELTAAKPLNIYPNPAQNKVNVEMDDNSPATISIYDMVGRKVKAITTNSKASTIIIENLEKGIYMIVSEQNNAIRSQKLIVE